MASSLIEKSLPPLTDGELLNHALVLLKSPLLTVQNLAAAVYAIKSIDPDHGLDDVNPELLDKFEMYKKKWSEGQKLPIGQRVFPSPNKE